MKWLLEIEQTILLVRTKLRTPYLMKRYMNSNVVHGKLSSHTVWIDENLTPKVHEYENNEGLQFDKVGFVVYFIRLTAIMFLICGLNIRITNIQN